MTHGATIRYLPLSLRCDGHVKIISSLAKTYTSQTSPGIEVNSQ